MHTGPCEKQALSSQVQQQYSWLSETFRGLCFVPYSAAVTPAHVLCHTVHRANKQPYSGKRFVPQLAGRGFCYAHVYLSPTSLSASPAANLLAHDNMQLMLHLSMDAGCDSGSQLLGGALEGADKLSKLIQQRVPGLLFSYLLVLQVSLKLLDICNDQRGRRLCHRYLRRWSGQKSSCQALHVLQQKQLLSQRTSAGERGERTSLVLGSVTLTQKPCFQPPHHAGLHNIQQQSHEVSCDRPLQALFVQGKIKVGVRVFYFIHSVSCDLH